MSRNESVIEEPAEQFDGLNVLPWLGTFAFTPSPIVNPGAGGGLPTSETGLIPFSVVEKYLSGKPLRGLTRTPRDVRKPQPDPAIVAFLRSTYDLSQEGKPRKASDLVFDYFEGHFEFGRFDVVDETLRQLDADRLSDTVLVAVLAVTAPVRDRLSARAKFLDQAEQNLTRANGPDKAEAILKLYR
jgi:hypothetical protein